MKETLYSKKQIILVLNYLLQNDCWNQRMILISPMNTKNGNFPMLIIKLLAKLFVFLEDCLQVVFLFFRSLGSTVREKQVSLNLPDNGKIGSTRNIIQI